MKATHTLLLTDIVDSTALTQRLGDEAMARLWVAHDRLARDLLRTWHGREIDKSDGLLALFERADDAAGFARDYQRALASLEVPLAARVGLHTGAISLRENEPGDVVLGAKPLEVEGVAKPTVARVMSMARGGQTLATAEAVTALTRNELRTQSHGFWRAKGLAKPFEVFELIAQGTAPLPPPGDSAKAYRVTRAGDVWLPVAEIPRYLPSERDAFVGRAAALDEIARRFAEGARLLSLVGIGGCGKTRLATHYAWSWIGEFPGGAWFCDLSAARDVDGIVRAVAAALDVPLSGDDPVVQLERSIAGRGECLLILDNFEQVARHASDTLGRWLDRAPDARFIVTTREVLGLAGEEVFAVSPMAEEDAAELFLRRAHSASHEFRPEADDEAAVGSLVRLLDGLPLAIELSAARVRVMPPHVQLQRMSERFRLLSSSGSRRDRQATLRATFDWSWDLLTEAEKAALAQLSVFEGGFTLGAAEAVVDLAGVERAPWSADVVHSLVDKSFVRPLGHGRFDLLVSVQEYAAEHLCTPGRFAGSGPLALEAAQARHRAHFATIDEGHAGTDRGADLANFVVACRRAVSAAETECAVALVERAWAALRLRGPFRIGHELATLALGMPELSAGQRGRAEYVAARALESSGTHAEAKPHFEAALALARDAGSPLGTARALLGLGAIHASEGANDAATRAGAEALALGEALCDTALQCEIHNLMGNIHLELRGDPHQALSHYEAGLAVARACGNRRWEAGLLGNVGNVRFSLGHVDEARANYEAALQAARDVGDRKFEGNMLSNLGWLHLTQGRPEEGRRLFEPALAIARELGHAYLESNALCNLALACEGIGRPEEAQLHYAAALAIAQRLQDRRTEGQILGYLGGLLATQGRFDSARANFERGAALLHESADRFSLGVLLCKRAEADRLAGDIPAARGAFQRAQALAKEVSAGADSELGLELSRVAALFDAAA